MKKALHCRLVTFLLIASGFLCTEISTHAELMISSYTTNAIVQLGSTATLSAAVTSDSAATYQWTFGDTPITDATNATLSITNCQFTNAGSYFLYVTNLSTSTNCGPILLDVFSVPPNTNVPAGSTLTLQTQVAGPVTPTYQWFYKGSIVIADATNSTFTISNIQTTNVGYYRVTCSVTNASTQSTAITVGIFFPPTNNPPGSIPAPPGLINYWPFEGNFSDMLSTNHLSPRGNVDIVPAEAGYGCSFDGSTGFLVGPALWIIPPWSASFWVYRLNGLNALNTSAALIGDRETSLKVEQYNNTHKVGFTQFGIADYVFNYIVPTNTWTHLVFVGTPTNTSLYVNGNFQESNPHSVNLPRNNIGADIVNGADIFHGTLDEIMLFNRALDPSEIFALYNAGSNTVIRTPEFSATSTSSDRTFQTTIRGLTGKTISVYASSNLADWTFLNTTTNTNGLVPFTDSLNNATGTRFYKATQQ